MAESFIVSPRAGINHLRIRAAPTPLIREIRTAADRKLLAEVSAI